MPGNSTRYTLPDWIENLSFEHALKLLLLYFTGGTVPPASGGGGIPSAPQTVTSSPHNLAASTTITIPAGAKGWTVTCITGTLSITCGTTASALPAGFSDSDTNIVGADITVTTGSASTAYVRWGT